MKLHRDLALEVAMERMARACAEHEGVLLAIRDQALVGARDAMRTHPANARQRILEGATPPESPSNSDTGKD